MLYLCPNGSELENIESNREDYQNDETGNRPFFHSRFDGFSFVLSEESLAGTAEGIDTGGVTGLQ